MERVLDLGGVASGLPGQKKEEKKRKKVIKGQEFMMEEYKF